MKETRYNIVVVICHDLGRRLGCYGAPDVRSPHIDAFAASGIRFENSFCTAPQCSPSRAALWTGRFPHANGVVGLTHAGFANDLNPAEKHLAQILRAAGYDCHLFGIQHESRSAERCGYETVHPGGPCRKVAGDFRRFIAERRSNEKPLFAQIGFFEPHRPFPHEDVAPLPPESLAIPPYLPDIPAVREDLSDIEASIASADRAFGSIVQAVRSSDIAGNTIIVFTADHGIAFPHAKMTLYDPGIEVALIVSAPGAPQGIVQREMISNVDVLPTLLDLVGLPHPPHLHGRSFKGLIVGGEYVPNEAIYAEKTYHTYYDPMRAIRTRRWKLIANFEFAPWQETSPDYDNNAKGYVEVSRALNVPYDVQYHPAFELYDLAADPYEQRNLADDATHRQTRDELIRALRQWMADTHDPLLDGPIAQATYRIRMAQFKAI
ncbi:MAG: sulfatase [Chloroflexi bacterium]|nr:sulfatase [Chloroflexota bacterium]MCL5273296.1 sulfatase [Chloroflexota bacterium]